ncbi:MAG: hypothetical protein GX785_20010 [Armatimonadetes bacterium]|nr:hypothetical protein [Armatimonadota bacterium]
MSTRVVGVPGLPEWARIYVGQAGPGVVNAERQLRVEAANYVPTFDEQQDLATVGVASIVPVAHETRDVLVALIEGIVN